jgi:hypothetical protein
MNPAPDPQTASQQRQQSDRRRDASRAHSAGCRWLPGTTGCYRGGFSRMLSVGLFSVVLASPPPRPNLPLQDYPFVPFVLAPHPVLRFAVRHG